MPDTQLRERTGTSADAIGGPGGVRVAEGDLRTFYDPAGRAGGRAVRDLLEDVAGTRAPSVLPGAGRLTGHEVTLAEALHACLATDGPDGVPLPVTPARQRAIAGAVDRQAETVAAAVTEVAGELERRWRRLRLRARGVVASSEHLVFAGRVLAAVAHDGAVRRNGRDYYSHPDEVAAILAAAWPRGGRTPHGVRLDVGRFLAYCHDAFEDTLDPVGGYLGRPLFVSPRVILAVLDRLAVPDAAALTRVMLLMTRTRATDGSRMTYLEHIERGIREGGSYFLLTKAGDIHHNLTIEAEHVDPQDRRAEARHRKRALYRLAADRLRDAADLGDHDTARAVHGTFAVCRTDLPPSPRTARGHLGHIAATVRDRLPAA